MHTDLALRRAATASAVLLATLCAMTLFSGVSQQWFEWVRGPDAYASKLLHDASWLRAIIALDDVFIAAYVATSILFVGHLGVARTSALLTVAMIFGVVAGVLDLEENHHLLALLRLAESDVAIPLDDIVRRSDMSQLKWMLGHAAFALIGASIDARSTWSRLFRDSLVFVQLPVGALTWAVPEGSALVVFVWLRYGALVSGFAMVAWLTASRRLVGDVAVGSGAPA